MYFWGLYRNPYFLIGLGTLIILWHGLNALRSAPRSELEFRAFSRTESSIALLASIVLIAIGCLLFLLRYYR